MKGSRKVRKKRERVKIRWYKIGGVVLVLVVFGMLCRMPAVMTNKEKLSETLAQKQQEYYDTQTENNRLKEAVAKSTTREFQERAARRMYDYCWYGETLYVLDDSTGAEGEQAQSTPQ